MHYRQVSDNYIFHKLDANLHDSKLPLAHGRKVAKVVAERTLTIDDIAQLVAEQGTVRQDAAVIAQTVNEFMQQMCVALCDGYNINTPWFSIHTEIRGTFSGNETTIDPEQHSVYACFQQGSKLRELYEDVEVSINKYHNREPRILSAYDHFTDTKNQLLTPGHSLTINGRNIKISGDDEQAGLYIVNNDTGDITRIEKSDIAVNTPKRIICLVPNMPQGRYRLRIITGFRSNRHNSSTIVIDHEAELTIA